MNASHLFVQYLLQHDVTHIFGVPGEENLHLLDALKNTSIEVIVTRNEQTAVFMAATYGRLTGKPWIAMATLWPGATNMLTGVAYAQHGAMPVIVITGQKPIKKSKQAQFQVIDVVGMMEPVTKFATKIISHDRVVSTLTQAFRIAQMERPGAVHIEFPEDISEEMVTQEPYFPPTHLARRPIAEDKALTNLQTLLEQSQKPIILIGAGANRKRVTKYLSTFITQYNIPFFSSQMGKWVVDESLPQCLGTAALTEHDYIHDIIQQADLILAIGHDTYEKPTHLNNYQKAKLIHINFYPAQVDDLYYPHYEVVGDIGHTCRRMANMQLDTSNWSLQDIHKQNTQNQQSIEDNSNQQYNDDVMMPARLVQEIHTKYVDNGIVCLDNGLYKVRFARNYKAKYPNTLLLDNALATMGAGYSSAMMAKILYPDKDVVAVVGDGWLMMNLGDIETAVRLNLDITIVILNDHAYGMIKRKQKNMGYTEYALDLQNPDFVALAKAFGAKGHCVKNPNDFTTVLETANTEKGVSIIDVQFAYTDTIA